VKVAGGVSTTIASVNSASRITMSRNADFTGTPLITFTSDNPLTITGTGKTVLTGTNTYGGQTFVNGGVLSINNNNQLNAGANVQLNIFGGTLQVTETLATGRTVVMGGSGGTFDVANGKTLTLSGSVWGGNLTLDNSDAGNGVLLLSGDNTARDNQLNGAVAIKGGVLKLGHNNALNLYGFNTLTFGSATNQTLQINGARTITVAGLTSVSTNAVVENGATGTAVFNVYNGADNTFAGVLRDGTAGTLAFRKGGGGRLTLTGANTYTGATTVLSGTLRVTGSLAAGTPVTVLGGVLDGNGTISGTVTNSATLAPGVGVGTLNVGKLVLTSASVLNYELGAPGGTGDAIAVAGSVTLAGVLNVFDAGGFGPGTYTLMTCTGTAVNNGITMGTVPNSKLVYRIDTSTPGSVFLRVGARGSVLILR
jgi:fibronectin-binding autotransporter adhesin